MIKPHLLDRAYARVIIAQTVKPGRFRLAAGTTATAFVPVGFSYDDEPTVNSQDELRRAVTSGE